MELEVGTYRHVGSLIPKTPRPIAITGRKKSK